MIPKDPFQVRDEILTRYGEISFETLLCYIWSCGIPVLETGRKKIAPLLKKQISCTSSKCEDDLYSFRRNMRLKINRGKEYRNERCKDCRVKLIDWKRIVKKALKDSKYLISSLKLKSIRKLFWDQSFDEMTINKVNNKTILEESRPIDQIRTTAHKIYYEYL